jgi:chemotaxis protein CheZ
MEIDPRALSQHDELLILVGHLTRVLHNSFRSLGLDKLFEHAAQDVSDARDRLDFVVRASGKAVRKALNATVAAITLH